MSYFDLYRKTDHPTCDVPFTGETPVADDAIVDLLRNDSLNITTLGEQIFDIASSLLVGKTEFFCLLFLFKTMN